MKLKFSVLGEPAGKGRPRFRNAGAFVQPYTPEKTVSYGDFADTHPHTHGNETDTLPTVSGDS